MLKPVEIIRSIAVSVFVAFVVLAVSSQVQAQKTPETLQKNGVVSVCKEIDDNWKCVGEAPEWEANKRFNVLFVNPVPVGTDFIWIVFHKQLPDGKDGDFLYEFQQNIGTENRKYATTESPFFLPAGTYTLYILSTNQRDSLYHKGNFEKYFAKMTLKVK